MSCYLIELNELKLMLMMQVLLVMKKKHYTKLVTGVTIVTIVSMFSAMITDLRQYWRKELQATSISQEGKKKTNRTWFWLRHFMVIFYRTQRRLHN